MIKEWTDQIIEAGRAHRDGMTPHNAATEAGTWARLTIAQRKAVLDLADARTPEEVRAIVIGRRTRSVLLREALLTPPPGQQVLTNRGRQLAWWWRNRGGL